MSVFKKAGAIRYPDRILIETWHSEPDGFSIVSGEVTFISADVPDEELGALLVRHLGLSLNKIPLSDKTQDQLYKEATGLKTLRAQMKDARFVAVCLAGFRITLTPTVNGGPTGADAGYTHKTDEEISVINSTDYARIGQALRKAWAICE